MKGYFFALSIATILLLTLSGLSTSARWFLNRCSRFREPAFVWTIAFALLLGLLTAIACCAPSRY